MKFGELPAKILCKEDCKGICPVCNETGTQRIVEQDTLHDPSYGSNPRYLQREYEV